MTINPKWINNARTDPRLLNLIRSVETYMMTTEAARSQRRNWIIDQYAKDHREYTREEIGKIVDELAPQFAPAK